VSLKNHITQILSQDAFCNLSDVASAYISHYQSILSKYPQAQLTASTQPPIPSKENTHSAFSFTQSSSHASIAKDYIKKEAPVLNTAPVVSKESPFLFKSQEEAPKPAFNFSSAAKPKENGTLSFSALNKQEPPIAKTNGATEKPKEDIPALALKTDVKVAPSFAFNSTSSFSLGSVEKPKETSSPALNFAPVDKPKETTPAFAFGSSEKTKDSIPAFSVKTDAKPRESAPSFQFGSSDKGKDSSAGFGFGSAEKQTDASPAFAFGSVSTPNEAIPSFSFGSTTSAKETPSAFSFGSTEKPKEGITTGFSFAATAGSTEKNSAFSFGGISKPKEDAPSFSFMTAAKPTTSTPSFSFGSTEKPKEELPSFNFAKPKQEESKFAFGSVSKSNDEGSKFAFGSPAPIPAFGSTKDGPLFSATTAETPVKSAFSFVPTSTPLGQSAFGASSFNAPVSVAAAETANEEDGEEELPKEEQVGDALLTGRAGEEDETIIHSVRSKVYKYEEGKWTLVGLGLLKLNENLKTQKSRILLRGEAGQVLLNAAIFSKMILSVADNTVKFAVSIEAGKITQFSARVKTKDDANALMSAMEKLKNKAC
jgi:hypothetical protein